MPLDKMLPSYLHSPSRYERKLVAFTDFLGWRRKIDWAEDNPSRLAVLTKLIRMNAMLDNITQGRQPLQKFTSFSDNVVMSAEVDCSRLPEILFRLGCGQFACAMLGFYVRGGVTIGSIIHDDHVVFGPALNRAYELESELAIYPRIVIDAPVMRCLKDPLPFIACEDDVFFINPFTRWFAVEIQKMDDAGVHHEGMASLGVPLPASRYKENPLDRLATVAIRLREELKSAPDEAAFRKLSWLVTRMALNEKIH